MVAPLAPLDRAFAALNNAGITAKHCHTCCQRCGHAVFADEEAYVFYHTQGAERVAEEGDRKLCLYYNSNVDQLSSRIIAVLGQHGMVTSGGERGKAVQVQLDDASKAFVADLFSSKILEPPPFSEAFLMDLMRTHLAQNFSN